MMDSDDELIDVEPRRRHSIPARFVVVILTFVAFFNVYAMRANLSVAIVAMSNSSGSAREDLASKPNESTLMAPSEPRWDSSTQGIILGSFFYGYVITQLPGGVMAERWGAKWLMGFGVLIPSILTLLTPLAASWGATALIVVRIIEGLAEGVTYPAASFLIGRWSPVMERSRLWSIAAVGSNVGMLVSMSLSGYLIECGFMGGWPSVFYLFGIFGCVWFVFWAVFVYETPLDHPKISLSELSYIRESCDVQVRRNIPWRSILTSVPVWTLAVVHFGGSWCGYTLLTEMPTYLSNVLHLDFTQTGVVSSLPAAVGVAFGLIGSYIADKLRKTERFSITAIRKLMCSVAIFGPSACFLAFTFVNGQPFLSIFLLCVASGFGGFSSSGYTVAQVDMSPNFAGTVMGITNGISNLSGFLAPYVTGVITSSGQTVENWRIVFCICSATSFGCGLLFLIFGSAELQPWDANPSPTPSTYDDVETIGILSNTSPDSSSEEKDL